MSDEVWQDALISLTEGDAKPFAALLRSNEPVPTDARFGLAELIDPELKLLDHLLVIKKTKQRQIVNGSDKLCQMAA